MDAVDGDLLVVITQKHESFVARSAIILNSDGVVAVIRDRLRGVRRLLTQEAHLNAVSFVGELLRRRNEKGEKQ